jgi:large conductance mechanosensitive channel
VKSEKDRGKATMKKFINEFKEFAVKGNVIDLAVGIIIGGAFGKIVTSLVNDIIMPIVSIIIGRDIFSFLNFKITPYGSPNPVSINLGSFLQVSFDFVLMAVSVFILVKLLNNLRKLSEKAIKLDFIKSKKNGETAAEKEEGKE